MVATSRNEAPFSLSAFLISDGPAGFLLSWVAGFVDTSAFIILFGLFTAHVTGNIALAGSSFVSSDGETTITRLLMLPTFMLAVALTSLLARYARCQKWSVFAVLLTAEAIALGVFFNCWCTSVTITPIGCTGRLNSTNWNSRRDCDGNSKCPDERVERGIQKLYSDHRNDWEHYPTHD